MTNNYNLSLTSPSNSISISYAGSAVVGSVDNIVTGSGAPSSAPSFVGYIYVDLTGGNAYVSTGTGSVSDWERIDNEWGSISGTLSDQTDLQGVLDLKADLVGGKVPASQLPSYVDDVLVYANLASFPATGETGKVYISEDTNFSYRWTGSSYVKIGGDSAWGSITGILSNQTDLQSALNAKQATLVSGTNIKTINGNTVLGSGDLTISSVNTLAEVATGSTTTPDSLYQMTSTIPVEFRTSGANPLLYLDEVNEWVGIGTSSPRRKTDILDATNPQLRLTHTDNSIFTDLRTGANGELVIDGSGGKVGIINTNPQSPLHVGTVAGMTWTAAGWLRGLEIESPSVIKWEANSGGFSHGIGNTVGGLYFIISNSDSSSGSAQYAMNIKDDGDIGINTTSPSAQLEILEGTGQNQLRLSYSNNVVTDLRTDSSGNLTITPSVGNVGIGETLPDEALHITKTGSDAFLKLERTDTSSTAVGIILESLGFNWKFAYNRASTQDLVLSFQGTDLFRFDDKGGFSALTGGIDFQGDLNMASNTIYGTNGGLINIYDSLSGDMILRSSPISVNFDMRFQTGTASTERVAILGTGEVGIGTTTPIATLHSNGSLATKTTTVTTTTDTLDTTHHIVLADDTTAGGAVTLTLPAASGKNGLQYIIKKIGNTANVVVDGNGAETIDGATTTTLTTQYESVTIVCNGTAWFII